MTRLKDSLPSLIAGLEPARPPAELRRRALTAARSALGGATADPDLWSRLWTSRALRLAWATALIALLIAHGALFISLEPPTAEVDSAFMVAGPPTETDLADIVNLGPLRPLSPSLMGDATDGLLSPSPSM